MADSVLINGAMHSGSSTSFKLGGEKYTGITSIGYGDKRSRTKAFGATRSYGAVGRTGGKYEVDNLKLKAYKAAANQIRAQLAALSDDGVSYGNAEVPATLQFIEGTDVITIEFERCAMVADSSTADEKPDPLTDDLEFDVMKIRRNGLVLFDATGES